VSGTEAEFAVDLAVATVDGVAAVYDARPAPLRSLLPVIGVPVLGEQAPLCSIDAAAAPAIRISVGLDASAAPVAVGRAIADAARSAAGLPQAAVRVRIARIEQAGSR
jgi:hypothetical protein